MTFMEIERLIVDFFEKNGADVDKYSDGEFLLDGASLVDTDVSMTALAIAINTALTSAYRKDE